MTELKDVGLTRNSDLVESGVDEFAGYTKPKPKKKEKKDSEE